MDTDAIQVSPFEVWLGSTLWHSFIFLLAFLLYRTVVTRCLIPAYHWRASCPSHRWLFASEFTNYCHAFTGTVLSIGTLATTPELWQLRTDRILFASHQRVVLSVCVCLGYLTVDHLTWAFAYRRSLTNDVEYITFHTGIVIAFALFLWRGTGGIACVVGLFSEFYSVMMGQFKAHKLMFPPPPPWEASARPRFWCRERLVAIHDVAVDVSFWLSRWFPCFVLCCATVAQWRSIVADPVMVLQLTMMLFLNVMNTLCFGRDMVYYFWPEGKEKKTKKE